MGARSVTAIVIQSTIEILVGGDLILLGLVLRQVALPLEAACWWRWRLSRVCVQLVVAGLVTMIFRV